MNTLENLETSYNRKIQIQIFEQFNRIDEAWDRYFEEKNKYYEDFLDETKALTNELNREKALLKGYRSDYRALKKALKFEYKNKVLDLKDDKNFKIGEIKENYTLTFAKIDSNYKKARNEYLLAIKEKSDEASERYQEFEIQFQEYRSSELEKKNKEKDTLINKTLVNYQRQSKKEKEEYLYKLNELKKNHSRQYYNSFKNEKRSLIIKYQDEISVFKEKRKNSEHKNSGHLKKIYSDYKTIKEDANKEIKYIKNEAKATYSRMSVQEKEEYKHLQKYIREDFQIRRLQKIDEKKAYAFRRVNFAYLFIAPAFLGEIFFTLIPCIFMIIGAFFRINFSNLSKSRFVGFQNFINIFTKDVEFQKALVNTVIFALITIVLLTVITVLMAAWLGKN
ncbi:MAG: hypothetical protein PHX62_08305, partial [Bacilli bacterium]|nr:hypothetical protein [Bacilli bacterium]